MNVARATLPAHLAGALALVVFFGATLPYLGSFPLIGQDEPWIAAPAAKLATQGVYGDDLFAGYYGMEQRAYNFPPLFPLAEALAFRALGVGVWPARLVAVLCGAATLLLTYALGRRLFGGGVAALAAWLLIGLRLAYEHDASGVPLLDLARIARYDMAVPPLVLAALLCLVWAEQRGAGWRYVLSGALAGLAALAHLYGGFVLPIMGALLLWRGGPDLVRRPTPYLLALGCALALLPWALYIAQAPGLYAGQMLPEQARFRLWEPAFYLQSLLREPARYQRLLFDRQGLALWPRAGIWAALLGLPLASGMLLWHAIARRALAERLLLLALPLLALQLALLVNLKFYNYIALLLPFVALELAWLGAGLWRAVRRWPGRWGLAGRLGLGLLLALVLAEGALGVAQSLRRAAATSDYAAYTRRVGAAIPAGARVLALHQFWFGVYARGYEYRSIVLAFYLSDPAFYRPAPLPIDQALAQIAPEYLLVDQFMAPELRFDRPAAALEDQQRRQFRLYVEQHCGRVVAQIDDRDYGALTVYRLCP